MRQVQFSRIPVGIEVHTASPGGRKWFGMKVSQALNAIWHLECKEWEEGRGKGRKGGTGCLSAHTPCNWLISING